MQEATFGAGVTVTETITTTNLTGNVYAEVLTSSGAVETSYTAIALNNGVATSSVHLGKSGDTIQVVDNVTTPTVTVRSSPVTITGPVFLGSGADVLALQVSEDAWNGNALFTVAVDGKQIGGTQTATASHAAGQTQTIDVLGNFAAGNHTATVNFLNDGYGGSSTTDRNLYVTGATIDGSTVSGAVLSERNQGPQSFTFLAPGSTTDTVSLTAPAHLVAGVQTVAGTESVPSQPVFLDWRTGAAPTLTASDWVQATVDQTGKFSASVNIAPSGVQGTLYYHTGAGTVLPAWSATPA